MRIWLKQLAVLALLVVIPTLIISWSGELIAQEASPSRESCEIKSVFQEKGWPIPGIVGARIEVARKPQLLLGSNGEPTEVAVTVLRPRKDITTKLRIYYFVNGQLKIRDQLVIVRQIYRFDWHGKVFAYGVRYPWAAMSNGKVSEAGKETQVLYYDDSGNGTFKTMNQFASFPFTPRVPDWASKSPGIKSSDSNR
jgi:hypothetical protein